MSCQRRLSDDVSVNASRLRTMPAARVAFSWISRSSSVESIAGAAGRQHQLGVADHALQRALQLLREPGHQLADLRELLLLADLDRRRAAIRSRRLDATRAATSARARRAAPRAPTAAMMPTVSIGRLRPWPALRSSVSRGARARFPAPPASAPARDHHRWIRRSPARCAWPARSASMHLPLALAPVLEVAGEDRRADRRSPGRAPAAAAAGSSASSRSSDARYWPRSPPRLQWIITLLPWTTRSPVKIVAARLVPERQVIRRVSRRVQRLQRFVAGRRRRRRRRSGRHGTSYCASSSGHGSLLNDAAGCAAAIAGAPAA